MVLLEHNGFQFKNILSGGYNILENEPDIISEITMADGSIKRNYGEMPKTSIKVKFGRLNKKLYKEYISHFKENEGVYSYFSPRKQMTLTKKFFVKFPESSILHGTDEKQIYDEFEIELKQCGEA